MVKGFSVGRGGGRVVSGLAIYSNNPTESYSFSVKIVFEKNENKQKEAGNWAIFNKHVFFFFIHFETAPAADFFVPQKVFLAESVTFYDFNEWRHPIK